jgi:hypothetical protein
VPETGRDHVAPDNLPRSRSGRIPQWVIDEAAGRTSRTPAPTPTGAPARASRRGVSTRRADGSHGTSSTGGVWRGFDSPLGVPLPPPAPRAAGRRRRSVASIAVVVLSALGVVVPLAFGHGWFGLHDPLAPKAAPPAGWPTPGVDEAAAPLGTPAPVATPSDAYSFLYTQKDGVTPVAFDPCRPVHYVVRPDGAPAGGEELLTAAIARVSAATGLQFINDGTTTESPSRMRELMDRDRYGDRWSPVLVAWESADENPDIAADVIGQATATPVSPTRDGRLTLVTGQVELDAAQLGALLAAPERQPEAYATVIHELGHLVGLGHVNDATQVMYPQVVQGVADFGAGDLSGLAQLGAGACAPDL